MRNIILTLSVMALLAGCTSKEEKALMQAYEKNRSYHKQLQKTEKTQLYDGDITKAMLTATYLNEQNIDKKDKPYEVFVVGVYLEESEEISLDQEGYSLTLNGNAPKSIQKVEKGDPVLENISFVSEWSSFYLVTFPHVSSQSFKLIFESDRYGKGELHFAKVAKYVLTKEAF
jgi:hypothetical protein